MFVRKWGIGVVIDLLIVKKAPLAEQELKLRSFWNPVLQYREKEL